MMTKFLDGLASLRSPFNVLMVFLTSVLIWLLETGKYWFVMHAFDFSVSFFALMLMNGIVNLATTIPSAPGYIGTFDAPVFGVLPAGQTAELILDAIARSDGTRASVLEELRAAKVEDGILGDFRIDSNGDITPGRLAIFRITGATPPDAPVFPQYDGAVFDRVIEVPATLARP